MHDDKIKYGLVGLVLGALGMWVISMLVSNSNGVGMVGYRNGNQAGILQNSSSIDSHFIEQMIPHHEDAITMAKIAQEKAQKPEIKELAENIIQSQGEEISQMEEWYKLWFGKEVPEGTEVMDQHGMAGGSGMHMGMMGDETDMLSFENAEDFDKEFIEEMIPHHQMAVMMASMLKGGSEREEMRDLADKIIDAQKREIDQMRQWYIDWGY